MTGLKKSPLGKEGITLERKQRLFLGIQMVLGLYLGMNTLWFATLSDSNVSGFQLGLSYLNPITLLLNLLPPMLLLCCFTFLTGRPTLSYGITSGLSLLLCLVNYYKIILRGQPLVFSDLGLIFEATTMVGEYTLDITLNVVVLCLLMLFGGFVSWYLLPSTLWEIFPWGIPLTEETPTTEPLPSEPPAPVLIGQKEEPITFDSLFRWMKKSSDSKGRLRFHGTLGSLGIFFIVWLGLCQNDTLYLWTENYSRINRLSHSEVYLSRGLWYPFLHSRGSTRQSSDNYLGDYYWDRSFQEGKPLEDISVISIMLEGFCDYTMFPNLAEEEGVLQVYEPWHHLMENSLSGNIINTVFGGGTAYTERSVITGIAGADDSFSQNTQSYVWDFRNAGYLTFGGHIGYENFYDRITVNQYLGFEKYDYYENRYADLVHEDSLYWSSDTAFFQSIIEDMESTRYLSQPSFGFYVTIQNHGPYDQATEENMKEPFVSESSGFSYETRAILQNYLLGIQDTLDQVTVLMDYVWEREDPIIVVLFGDHKPWGGNNHSVFVEVGAVFDTSTISGMMDYYSTPYVIFANQAAQTHLVGEYPADGGDISNHFLMNHVFNLVGWEQSDYMALGSLVMSELPVVFRGWEYAYWIDDEVVVDLPPSYQEVADYYLWSIQQRRSNLYTP